MKKQNHDEIINDEYNVRNHTHTVLIIAAINGRSCFAQIKQVRVSIPNLSFGYTMSSLIPKYGKMLKIVAAERICLSCWFPTLKDWLEEFLGSTLSQNFGAVVWRSPPIRL